MIGFSLTETIKEHCCRTEIDERFTRFWIAIIFATCLRFAVKPSPSSGSGSVQRARRCSAQWAQARWINPCIAPFRRQRHTEAPCASPARGMRRQTHVPGSRRGTPMKALALYLPERMLTRARCNVRTASSRPQASTEHAHRVLSPQPQACRARCGDRRL